METHNIQKYTIADFKSDQALRWCPGCGDYGIYNSLLKTMVESGIPPYETVIISGIGCSSRLPYYTKTYGFHTIHGRGAAIATGVKVANPQLTVWQITGDGDCLAIGGNHFIHSIRRNVDINVLIFNNQIYGLTKGQYSPTTKKGFVTKSSPYGTIERPFRPGELTLGARGTFFARTLDVDLVTSQMVMKAALHHKGTSVVECLVNCIIFNNGANDWLSEKETRADRTIVLEHGKRMIFGKNKDKGLILENNELKVVTIGENNITENDILIHDATTTDYSLQMKLALMECPKMPIALGIIRDIEEETFEEAMEGQIKRVQSSSSIKTFDDLIAQCEQWEI